MSHFHLCLFAVLIFALQLSAQDSTTDGTTVSSLLNSGDTENENREGKEIAGNSNLQHLIESHGEMAHLNELDSWEAPIEIRKSYAYYLSGYDDDGRPIWISELGKWNYRRVTDGTEDFKQSYDKYLDQLAHRVIKSIKERSTPENPIVDTTMIIDMAEFDLLKMAHLPTVTLILRTLSKFKEIIEQYLHAALVINTSAPAHTLFNLARPILGRSFERAQIFGTNKATWIPQLLKYCPRDQIPEWYGGKKEFTPVKVYG